MNIIRLFDSLQNDYSWQHCSQYSLKDYLEVVVVAVEGLGHVGGDVGVAAGEEHVDHVRGEGRDLHTRGARVARGRG